MLGKFNRLWAKLVKPSDKIAEDEQFQAQLLSTLILLILPLGTAVSLVPLLVDRTPVNQIPQVPVMLFVIVTVSIAYWLTRTQYYKISAFYLIVIAFLAVQFAAYVDNSPRDLRALYFTIIPILASTLFFSLRFAILWTAIGLASMFLVPLFLPEVTARDVIVGPFDFTLIVSATALLGAQFRDYLEQRRQRKLAQREAQYRLLFEGTFSGIAIVTNGRIQEVNTGLCTMFNYEATQLHDRNWLILFATETQKQLEKTNLAILTQPQEAVGIRRDGKRIYVEFLIREQPVEDGNTWLVAFRDITERKEAEQAIQQRAAELEILTRLSTDLRKAQHLDDMNAIILRHILNAIRADSGSIFLYDPEKELLVSQVGYSPFRGEVHRLQDIFHRPGRGIVGHVYQTGEMYISEDLAHDPLVEELPPLKPHLKPIQTSISIPLYANKQVLGVINIGFFTRRQFTDKEVQLLQTMSDIGANAIHRAQLMATLEQRVVERTRELEVANEKLKELDKLKSKFIADISHEFRTPLANAILYLDLLERGRPEKREYYMHVLREKMGQLERLTEDILDISRLEMEQQGSRAAVVDLNELVQTVVRMFHEQATEANLILRCQIAASLPLVKGDRGQLMQMLTHLVRNALQFTLEGEVEVSTGLDEGRVRLRVRDTGVGISDDELPHVFERFYRGREVVQLGVAGTGLGLSIVREIVTLHDGDIMLQSRSGEGTTVTVWLPVAGDGG
ncbi:MAG: PAS domain-containing sensor histidine kinase [Chloroflexi bacterium]|nr:MAG: PAS domain-containing sensor histidine kinase [Chloroflexota bacterium]